VLELDLGMMSSFECWLMCHLPVRRYQSHAMLTKRGMSDKP